MLYEVRERRPEAKIVLCEPFLFRLRPEEVSYGTDIIENWDTWYGEICRRAEAVDIIEKCLAMYKDKFGGKGQTPPENA